ncbi:MAG: hypothetical protein M3T49_10335, partial [Candidatus Eremiobacteraeota bacterium]|nr:hypothetical protein [Candidatus Eremiobacteraeota bacterium]
MPEFYSGATGQPGHFSEGFCLRRLHAAEAASDGLYVVRTSLPAETLGDADTVRSYKSLARVERAFRC